MYIQYIKKHANIISLILVGGLLVILLITVFIWFELSGLFPAKGLLWHGITIGESGPSDVVAQLGEPDQEERKGNTYYYKYLFENQPKPVIVVIRFGRVQRVEENLLYTNQKLNYMN